MKTNKLINEAIGELATIPTVFSAADVAARADLSGVDNGIERALQAQCSNQSIITLDEQAIHDRRYLGKKLVEQWWISSTLRRAKRGVFHMTTGELAREMSLGFDVQQWNTPPNAMLEIGRQMAMVSSGYVPGTFVFPWSVIVHNNRECVNALRSIYASQEWVCESEIDAVLRLLTEQEADVVRSRRGLDTGHPATLEQIGNRYGVTRERIRQIEQRAYRKLRHPSRGQYLWRAFATDFLQCGGSLIIPETMITPLRKFLIESIGLKIAHIPELKHYILSEVADISSYREILCNVHDCLEIGPETPCFSAIGALQFLSKSDGEQVSSAENEYRTRHIARRQPYMLRCAFFGNRRRLQPDVPGKSSHYA